MVNCGDCGNEKFEKAYYSTATLKFKEYPPVELFNSFNPRTMVVNLKVDADYCPCGKFFIRGWELVKREWIDEAENMRQMIEELA